MDRVVPWWVRRDWQMSGMREKPKEVMWKGEANDLAFGRTVAFLHIFSVQRSGCNCGECASVV